MKGAVHKAERWFECVQRLRPFMEFSRTPEGANASAALRSNVFGEYKTAVQAFLTRCFRVVEHDYARPYLRERFPADCTKARVFSGAFTVFPRFIKSVDRNWIPVFINWDSVKDSINSGFRSYCESRRDCPLQPAPDHTTCDYFQEHLGEFLDQLPFSCSRLVERRLPRKGSVSFDLQRLASYSKKTLADAFHDLWTVYCSSRFLEPLIGPDHIAGWQEVWPSLKALDCKSIIVIESALEDLYRQFTSLYLFQDHASAIEPNRESAGRSNVLALCRPPRYSLGAFLQFVLSMLVVPDAQWFSLFHLGPSVTTADIGTATLALNSLLSLDLELRYGTTILFETAVSSIGRQEAEIMSAEIRAKESAIRHYGHTMGHRIAPVVAYFDKHDIGNEAAGCARLVSDISLVLQAYAVKGEQHFYRLNAEKGNRFVVYDRPLDILGLMEGDIKTISPKDVQMADRVIHRHPLLEVAVKEAYVNPEMRDVIQGRQCRLHDAFFAQLLSELVINAVQHGYHMKPDETNGGTSAGVRIRVGGIVLDGRPAVVLSNYFTAKRKPTPSYFQPD